MRIVRRLSSAWNRHSFGTLLLLIAKNFTYYLGEIFSRRLFRKSEEHISEFDIVSGTDTEKICEIGSLDINSENARHAVRYQPSPHDFASEIIQALPIDYSQFTFIDFGAGKGRVLLIAAQLPFAAVIGIEFSQELCAIASNNINKIPENKRMARLVECHYNDATLYHLPETPLVCYFYNPFDQLVMRRVIDNLSSSLRDKQREIYIIYVHPEHRSLFDADGCWEVIDESGFHVTYRCSLDKLLKYT